MESEVGTESKASGRDATGPKKRRPVIEPIEDGLAGLTEIPRGKDVPRRAEEGAAPTPVAGPPSVAEQTSVPEPTPMAEQTSPTEQTPVAAPMPSGRIKTSNRAMTFLVAVIAIVGVISAMIMSLLVIRVLYVVVDWGANAASWVLARVLRVRPEQLSWLFGEHGAGTPAPGAAGARPAEEAIRV